MNRWIIRVIGILMLVGFMLIFVYMQKRLVELQQMRQPAAPATGTR
jgi:hypothetical protein